jgi:membrane-associated HD superfamily phosphohydrolase
MLAARTPTLSRFTRSDATRLGIAAVILVLLLTAILASDLLPEETVQYQSGDVALADIVAPRAIEFDSAVLTEQARAEARDAVQPQYDFTADRAIAIAAEQATAFDLRVRRVDTAFNAGLTEEDRASLLETAVSDLTDTARGTLMAIDLVRWTAVRTEAARVLDDDPADRVA